MATATPLRTVRILRYLATQPEPVHYRRIATALRDDAAKVGQTCNRLSRLGRLRWCGPGLYALAAEDTHQHE